MTAAIRLMTGAEPVLLVAAGVVLVLLGIDGLRHRPLARMEDALPDAVAGAEIPEDLDGVQAETDRALTTVR